jgi:Phosphotransferase enzyme family
MQEVRPRAAAVAAEQPSLLDVDSVIGFLVERGLLRRRDLFSGKVLAEAVSRRNRNLRVSVGDAGGFFIKQVEPTTAFGVESLRREVAFYTDDRSAPVRRAGRAPTVLWSDARAPVLVLDLLPNHHTLWSHYGPSVSAGVVVECYQRLAHLLARVHGHGPLPPDSMPDAAGGEAVPWVFEAHRPPAESLVNLSPATAHALSIIQASETIRSGFDRARESWRTSSFIHADLRSDNVQVPARPGATLDVRLIDWELARPGDPLWDVACLIDDLLLYWVGGMDTQLADADVARVVASARVPWSTLQPAVRVLWYAYTGAVRGDFPAVEAATSGPCRLASFIAVRAVQAVLEMTDRRSHLPPQAVLLLQLAENLFTHPEQTARDFLGIA